MEWLGGLGIVVSALGFVVAAVGFAVMVIGGVRHDRRLTVGLRIGYGGMAVAILGSIVFILSRPPQLLPLPFKLVFALVVGTTVIRLAVAAAFSKPPRRD